MNKIKIKIGRNIRRNIKIQIQINKEKNENVGQSSKWAVQVPSSVINHFAAVHH